MKNNLKVADALGGSSIYYSKLKLLFTGCSEAALA